MPEELLASFAVKRLGILDEHGNCDETLMPVLSEALNRGLNERRVPAIPAIATKGEGVVETFSTIVQLTLESLARHYEPIALPQGQTIEDWTAQAVQAMFGAGELPGPTCSGGFRSDSGLRRVVHPASAAAAIIRSRLIALPSASPR